MLLPLKKRIHAVDINRCFLKILWGQIHTGCSESKHSLIFLLWTWKSNVCKYDTVQFSSARRDPSRVIKSRHMAMEESQMKEGSSHICLLSWPSVMEEPQNIWGNRFTNMVIRQCIMALIQGGIRDIWGGDHPCIVIWNVSLTINRSTETVESIAHIHDLFSAQLSSHEFRTVCCGLNTSLYFTEPAGKRWSDQMKDANDGRNNW